MPIYPVTPGGRRLGYARHFFHDHRFAMAMADVPGLDKSQIPPVFYTVTAPVRDQGLLGDCVEFAATSLFSAMAFIGHKAGTPWHGFPEYSPEELYYVYRQAINDIQDDCGSSVLGAMDVLCKNGVCLEKFCPYDPAKFTQPPSAEALKDAATHKPEKTVKINTLDDMVRAIASHRYGFVAGIAVFESFEEAWGANGIIPIPGQDEQLLGGHGVYIHDYDLHKKTFRGQNSWGTEGGLKFFPGHFEIPFDYLTDPDLCWECGTLL